MSAAHPGWPSVDDPGGSPGGLPGGWPGASWGSGGLPPGPVSGGRVGHAGVRSSVVPACSRWERGLLWGPEAPAGEALRFLPLSWPKENMPSTCPMARVRMGWSMPASRCRLTRPAIVTGGPLKMPLLLVAASSCVGSRGGCLPRSLRRSAGRSGSVPSTPAPARFAGCGLAPLHSKPRPLSRGARPPQVAHSHPTGSPVRLGACNGASGDRACASRCAAARLAHLVRLPLSETCCAVHLPLGPSGAGSPVLACLTAAVASMGRAAQAKPSPLRVGAHARQVLHLQPRTSWSRSGSWKSSPSRSGELACQALALTLHFPRLPLSEICPGLILGVPRQAILTRPLREAAVVAMRWH